jgi:hypothetical protein
MAVKRSSRKTVPLPPTVSKQAAYVKVASNFNEAIDVLIEVMRTSNNPSDRIAAAKTIINKVVPDIKANELTDDGAKTLGGLIKLFTSGNTP